jgi:hypothetical protein
MLEFHGFGLRNATAVAGLRCVPMIALDGWQNDEKRVKKGL